MFGLLFSCFSGLSDYVLFTCYTYGYRRFGRVAKNKFLAFAILNLARDA